MVNGHCNKDSVLAGLIPCKQTRMIEIIMIEVIKQMTQWCYSNAKLSVNMLRSFIKQVAIATIFPAKSTLNFEKGGSEPSQENFQTSLKVVFEEAENNLIMKNN